VTSAGRLAPPPGRRRQRWSSSEATLSAAKRQARRRAVGAGFWDVRPRYLRPSTVPGEPNRDAERGDGLPWRFFWRTTALPLPRRALFCNGWWVSSFESDPPHFPMPRLIPVTGPCSPAGRNTPVERATNRRTRHSLVLVWRVSLGCGGKWERKRGRGPRGRTNKPRTAAAHSVPGGKIAGFACPPRREDRAWKSGGRSLPQRRSECRFPGPATRVAES